MKTLFPHAGRVLCAVLTLGVCAHAADVYVKRPGSPARTATPPNPATSAVQQQEIQTAFFWPIGCSTNNCNRPIVYSQPAGYVQPVSYARPISYPQPVSNCAPVAIPAASCRPVSCPPTPCAPCAACQGGYSPGCTQCGVNYGSPGGLVAPGTLYQGINYQSTVPGAWNAPASVSPIVPVNYQVQSGGALCPQCGVTHPGPHPTAAPVVLPAGGPSVWPTPYPGTLQQAPLQFVPAQPYWTGEENRPSQLNVDKPRDPGFEYNRDAVTVTDRRTRPEVFQRVSTDRPATPFYP